MSVHCLKCQSFVEWIETLTIVETTMVYVIEAVKEDPGEVSVTEEELKDVALCQLHYIKRDTLRKEVGIFFAENINRVRTIVIGPGAVVKCGNKKRNGGFKEVNDQEGRA